jgi:hypothetical protein
MNAIDFHTWSGNIINYFEVFTDNDMNLYLSGSFRERIFFQDTFLVHCNTPYTLLPDIFVIKLNQNYEVVWADIIGGTLQDKLNGFAISDDDNIYMVTEHSADIQCPTTVSFFEQDTACFDHGFVSILKMDKDKNLIWRNEFHGRVSGDFFIGADNNIHYQGYTPYNVIINDDTLFNIYNPNYYQPEFIISYDPEGVILQARIIDYKIRIRDMEINSSGEYFISGTVLDTLILEQDTVIVPPGFYYNILMKFNNEFELMWYKILIAEPDQTINSFQLRLIDENIIFSTTCDKNVQFEDTLLSLGNNMELVMGEYTTDGQLVNIIATKSTGDLLAGTPIVVDNCGDIINSGSFKGSGIFTDDTLYSSIGGYSDFFIAKLDRVNHNSIYLGPDTTVCKQFTITAPNGYLYYSWNDTISNQNYYLATQTGTYYFACSNKDGCWLYDTINIDIHPGFEINLGSDTTIRENDTIVLSVVDQFESYLWSDGSTSNLITIIGSDYGLGTFPIWVEVSDGPCIVTDTIIITIENAYGLDELLNSELNVFPTPFAKEIIIELKSEYQSIEIYNQNNDLLLIEDLKLESVKTKDIKAILKGFSIEKKVLVVLVKQNLDIVNASNNLENVKIILANSLNCVDILNYPTILMVEDAVEVIENTYKL